MSTRDTPESDIYVPIIFNRAFTEAYKKNIIYICI